MGLESARPPIPALVEPGGPSNRKFAGVSLRTSSWIALSLIALALIAYARVWGVAPSADDFGPPLYDILVGRRSLTELIVETRQPLRIRPLQSFSYWLLSALAGTGDDLLHPRLHAVIHGASLLVHIAHVVLAVVIARRFLGWVGCTLTALVVALHPAGVAGVASVDGLSTLLSAVALWGSVAYAVHHPERPRRTLALALIALTIAFLQKEYILCITAILPLAVWALPFDLDPRFQRKSALMLGTVLLGWALSLLALRFALYPASLGGLGAEIAAPRGSVIVPGVVAKNLGLAAAGLGFFGNTAVLFTREHPIQSLVELGWSGAVLFGALWGGWSLWARTSLLRAARMRVLGFALVAVPLSLVPEVLVTRMSEMYLGMALLPWGLALGVAYETLAERIGSRARLALTVAGIATCVLFSSTVWAKVTLMVESGAHAMRHVRLMRDEIPEGARDTEVHIVFDARTPKRPGYSVYLVPERDAASSEWTLLSVLPGRNLRLVSHKIESQDELEDLRRAHPVGVWLHYRPDLGQYVRLSEPARSGAL